MKMGMKTVATIVQKVQDTLATLTEKLENATVLLLQRRNGSVTFYILAAGGK